MRPSFGYFDGTLTDTYQVGSIVFTDNSGVLEIKDALSSLKRISVADPIDDQDAITKHSIINIPSIRNYIIVDYVANISTSATKNGMLSESTMMSDGEIIGIASYVEIPRTGGSAVFYATVNNVTQNGAGQSCVIDSTNTRRTYQRISPAIQYSTGQSIGIRSITSSYAPNNTKAIITLFLRDR